MSSHPERICAWCYGPIGRNQRADARFCRTLCRQAAHRFQAGMVRRSSTGERMRLGYADPPYPGKARRCYQDHPDYDGEVDHGPLVGRLMSQYPDGWALSTSAAALPRVLELCPPGVRVAAWFRGERAGFHLQPLNAWEPVIYHGGRELMSTPQDRRVDSLVHVSRARTTDPRRVVGAKPAAFAWWLFRLLGALPHDRFDDLFPGSGGIARAWALYSADHDGTVEVVA